MPQFDSIVLGAGLSGLACATKLQKQGINAVVFEAASEVGGRVKSRTSESGFLFDEGFQVLLNSYPELSNFVDLHSLNLKKFNSGALVYTGEKLELLANPILHPETLLSSLIKSRLTTKDKALILKLITGAQCHTSDAEVIGRSTNDYLKEFGFSEDFIEIFWRPFLTGIMLDHELKVDAGFFLFLMKCFSVGKVSLPENGMKQLPLQISLQLKKDTLFLNKKVKSWDKTSVTLESGETFHTKKVICAFDPADLVPQVESIPYQSVTTYYFTSPQLENTKWGKWLILIPRQFGLKIDHMTLLSETAPRYGGGRPLLSVSVVGSEAPDEKQVSQEVNRVAGFDLQLEFLEKIKVKKALPAITENKQGFKEKAGVIYCGDRWASASINGALRSGRLAAEQVLQQLKGIEESNGTLA